MKKNTGQEFIAAIIGILKEKNASGVYFDPWSFDPALLKDTLPWRKRSDKMIDTVSVPCMWAEDITGSDWTDDDKKRAQEKHFPDCICISVEDGRQIRYGFFDGSEDEDFDSLFHDVYDKLWNGDIETVYFLCGAVGILDGISSGLKPLGSVFLGLFRSAREEIDYVL